MNILYAFLLVLVVYPVSGALMFALLENLGISTKLKIYSITFGHPLLAGTVIWVVCVAINREIADAAVLLVTGTLLGIPFSEGKYFSGIVKEQDTVTIEYLSQLLKRRTITLPISEITGFVQSKSRNLFDKPSELKVVVSNQTLKFKILDKNTNLFL